MNMNFGLIILTLTLMRCSFICVHCRIKEHTYMNYVARVIDHLSTQNGWQSMENLNIRFTDGTISVPVFMAQKIDKCDLSYIFRKMVNILNYRYNEIVKTFVALLNIVVDTCERFLDDQLMTDFSVCIFLLETAVNNSKMIFDAMYSVMTFISYIDLNAKSQPYTIVDDIHQIISDEYFKKKNNDLSDIDHMSFMNVKSFIKNTSAIANRFCDPNSDVFSNTTEPDIVKTFEIQLSSQPGKFSDVVNFTFQHFYKTTMWNNIENLGFFQLLYPEDFK